jgi:hypothetical protein
MAQAQDLKQTITSVAGRPGPVLSAYLSVNADIPENQGRAYLVRLRDAMNDEGVPQGLQRRVREYTAEETHPGPGRSPSSRTKITSSRSTGYRSTFPSRSAGETLTWPR